MNPQVPGEEPGRRLRPRYPLGRLLLVVVAGFIASSVLQLVFPELGAVARLLILAIIAALISIVVTVRQQKGPSR